MLLKCLQKIFLNKMKIINSLLFIVIIYSISINAADVVINPFSYLSPVTLQVMENCKLKGESEVKQFSDCDKVSNYTNNQICCYVFGINTDGSSYKGCVAMDLDIFGNKTMEYKSDKLTGTLICDINYNFEKYLKSSNILFSFIFIASFLL